MNCMKKPNDWHTFSNDPLMETILNSIIPSEENTPTRLYVADCIAHCLTSDLNVTGLEHLEEEIAGSPIYSALRDYVIKSSLEMSASDQTIGKRFPVAGCCESALNLSTTIYDGIPILLMLRHMIVSALDTISKLDNAPATIQYNTNYRLASMDTSYIVDLECLQVIPFTTPFPEGFSSVGNFRISIQDFVAWMTDPNDSTAKIKARDLLNTIQGAKNFNNAIENAFLYITNQPMSEDLLVKAFTPVERLFKEGIRRANPFFQVNISGSKFASLKDRINMIREICAADEGLDVFNAPCNNDERDTRFKYLSKLFNKHISYLYLVNGGQLIHYQWIPFTVKYYNSFRGVIRSFKELEDRMNYGTFTEQYNHLFVTNHKFVVASSPAVNLGYSTNGFTALLCALTSMIIQRTDFPSTDGSVFEMNEAYIQRYTQRKKYSPVALFFAGADKSFKNLLSYKLQSFEDLFYALEEVRMKGLMVDNYASLASSHNLFNRRRKKRTVTNGVIKDKSANRFFSQNYDYFAIL